MNENESRSKIIEISGPKVPKLLEENTEEEPEQNNSEIESIRENGNINQENQNQNINLVNLKEREEEKEQEQEQEKEKDNEEENETEKEEEKEKIYIDEETQKNKDFEEEDKIEKEEEKSKNIEITTNNNFSSIINTNNLDIAKLVRSNSYLTSLPLSSKNRNKRSILSKEENIKTFNCLKEKESSLYKEINIIKEKRNKLTKFSFENIGVKNVIECNIRETQLKDLKKNENYLMEKLEEIKLQISDLINNEKQLNRRNNIKQYLEKLKSLNEANKNNDLISKTKSLEAESNKYREKKRIDLEKAKQKKIDELNKKEEDIKNQKLSYLKAQREKEIEIMRKRKKEIDEIVEKTKKSIKNKPNFDPKNYLYNKLANQYEENEKKFLEQQKLERKSKNSGIEEIDVVRRKIIESKIELEKRRLEKTNEMHKLWHSRSLVMPKYQSNILKKINEFEAKQAEDEEKVKIKKIVLIKEKEKYGENIQLPPISQKLKGEREKRQITFLNFEGKDRVKIIKDELSKNKYKNRNNFVEEHIFKNNDFIQKYHEKLAKSIEKEKRKQKLIKSASCQNILGGNVNKILIKNIGGHILSPVTLKRKRPNEINYLEDLKKERKIENQKINYNWNKEINGDVANVGMVKKKIEVLEEKYQREKDLMKAKGGYLLNQDMSNELNNIIINSIKGKLAIIENFCS